MKETRTCAMCPETFNVKTTSNRLNCSTHCSRAYDQRPERKQHMLDRSRLPENKEKQRQYRQRQKTIATNT